MKNKKETAPTTEKERENFWLEIGPASAYYGTDSYETAKENGDASPDLYAQPIPTGSSEPKHPSQLLDCVLSIENPQNRKENSPLS